MTDQAPPRVTAAVLVIGDEILSGRTQDKNLPWLAVALNERGIQVREARIVSDQESDIIAAVQALKARHDYVFTTGGIGPTHDDITASCMAKAFGTVLEANPEAVRRLSAYYPAGELTEARLRMAMIPVGATLIDNPVSIAPGFVLENVHVMAGVPRIMQSMFAALAPHLKGGVTLLSRTVLCLIPESRIAKDLGALQEANPGVSLGSYPFSRDDGSFGTRIVARGPSAAVLDRLAAEVAAITVALGFEATVEG